MVASLHGRLGRMVVTLSVVVGRAAMREQALIVRRNVNHTLVGERVHQLTFVVEST